MVTKAILFMKYVPVVLRPETMLIYCNTKAYVPLAYCYSTPASNPLCGLNHILTKNKACIISSI